ncbi:SGNH/GDSL hydrolase family protein [Actinomadura alba]|uniref:SGNH/GDSL hydrolase family protein n=1 Tax=Actinomadura alba TaxID=406431 RepID=A0ABR7M2K9_9ACTN|nr:SGNH/GDSL hydrolase family protein [Actinomadura alba]MBC6471044.1 SGNH/GDSL hydrolase family protein [Actinomadura alba]
MRRLVPYAVAAILTVSGCTAAASQSPQRSPQPSRTTGGEMHDGGEHAASAPVVMILGDSYTAGIPGTPPESTYAAEVARTLGWQIIIAGYRGTGFVAPGRIGKTFQMLFDEELAWRPAPDMIIVAGGHNDWPHGPGLVTAAARQLLTKIRQQWPSTRLVLTGPMAGSDPRPQALSVRDALKGVASELRLPFIDPLQEQWITGNVRKRTGTARLYIRRDGVHPNAAGNRYFADRFVADLRRLGLDEPRLPARGAGHQGP